VTTLAEILELEMLADRAWPALERRWLDGWLLRASEGLSRRSNSATPIEHSREPILEKVATVERWFAERGLPAMFRLTPLADRGLDDVLYARGYDLDLGADVMVRKIGAEPDDGVVRLERTPSAEWLGCLPTSRGTETMRRMLETVEDAVYASVVEEGRLISVGMGVVDSGWLAVFNMQTVRGRRRRGFGRTILDGLLRWAAGRGIENAMLQVHPAAMGAVSLYRSAGFEKRYDYRYRSLRAR